MSHKHALLLSLTLLFAIACGGGEDVTSDAGATGQDASPPDVLVPGDPDNDEWMDADDNCPAIFNPEQRDRDNDGVGDVCDTCPSTPNGGQNGQPAQNVCALAQETEPNDAPGQAMQLAPIPGRIVAVSGVLEAPRDGRQARDLYAISASAGSLISIRVARASADSLLEPAIEATGGTWTSSRTAEGPFIAERQLYFSTGDIFEIAVFDRRGGAGSDARGGPTYAYELSIQELSVEPERLTAPVQNRAIRLEPRGKIGVYEVDLGVSMRTRIEAVTQLGRGGVRAGIDPILAIEDENGMVLAENDDFAPGRFDARVLRALSEAQTLRVIVDHERIIGDEALELRLTIDQIPDDFELEPNNTQENASPLIYPGISRGIIDAPEDGEGDVDVWSFSATAGSVGSFRGLVTGQSRVDPIMVIGQFRGQDFVPMYLNTDSSGISSRIDAIFPRSGTYYLAIAHQPNVEGANPPMGGDLFPYSILTERPGLEPVSELLSDGSLSGTVNPGGKLVRHIVTTSAAPQLIELKVANVGSEDLEPFIRVYGPSAVGLLAEGADDVFALFDDAATYVVAVHNANDGLGAADFSYDINADLTLLTRGSETEPNDNGQATPSLPWVIDGTITDTNDIDRYLIDLVAGQEIDFIVINGPDSIDLNVFAPGSGAPAASQAGSILDFAVTSTGTHVLQIEALMGDYTIVVK